MIIYCLNIGIYKCIVLIVQPLYHQEHFIESYIHALHREQKGTDVVTKEEMDQLLKELQAFMLASHFFWGLWSVCYASISTIPFDYWVSIFILVNKWFLVVCLSVYILAL
jgi:hypothetical protein